MKNIYKIILFWVFAIIFANTFVSAQNGRWWDYGSDPLMIFETMVDDANDWWYAIQETALDGVTDLQWWYARPYKITNTLDYIRTNVDPYLQRVIYAWMVLATIALIYAWFLLVTNSIHKQWDRSKVKSNIIYALLWVFLLSWFYFIIKVIVALITSVFWWSNWDTWF